MAAPAARRRLREVASTNLISNDPSVAPEEVRAVSIAVLNVVVKLSIRALVVVSLAI